MNRMGDATAIVGGGRDMDEVFQWMINKIDGGSFVANRATETDAYYNYIYGVGPMNDFLNQLCLPDIVTESHFDNPDHYGRLTTFLVHMSHDKGNLARGMGLNESATVCIEPDDIRKIYGSVTAYFLTQTGINTTPETCFSRSRLDRYRNEKTRRLYKIKGTRDGSPIFNVKT